MSANELQNWLALYVATVMLCGIAATVTAITVVSECARERVWRTVHDTRSALLFVPRLWLRWQARYFLGTPSILPIVSYFAATLDWSH